MDGYAGDNKSLIYRNVRVSLSLFIFFYFFLFAFIDLMDAAAETKTLRVRRGQAYPRHNTRHLTAFTVRCIVDSQTLQIPCRLTRCRNKLSRRLELAVT